MFSTARFRLTAWYVLILAVIVGILSAAIYSLILVAQEGEIHTATSGTRDLLERVMEQDEVSLAYHIAAVDLLVLALCGVGAYMLAGRTLRPIHDAMERQRRFAAAASHELRTPLTALHGSLEVALLRRREPAEYERVLREAVDETERMGHLIQDLMEVARAEEGGFRFGRTDLSALAAEAVSDVLDRAERKSQRIDLDSNGNVPVRADASKLRQALVNLVDNAVTYTPSGGMVRVVTRIERGSAVLEVRDTGCGIEREHIPHLFEAFYQVDASRAGRDHVGLGLSLADWIVRAHDGSIRVESQVGVGSAFKVILPLTN